MEKPPTDPRLGRRTPEKRPVESPQDELLIDLERIAISPYLSRLTAVTQVLAQSESAQVVHNRMTHSMKVASVAGSIATHLNDQPGFAPTLAALGGCEPLVAQAAGWIHDTGHPPFGHRGEQALDRLAKSRFGIQEGFEGNAQTFRTIVELDVCDTATNGLNLTAAVRASVVKYPWSRRVVHPAGDELLPLGAKVASDRSGPAKMSAYVLNFAELEAVRDAYPAIGRWKQTVECSVMDIADDITYALHDLDDFYRAGVLRYPDVSREFTGWLAAAGRFDDAPVSRVPGASLERLRRRMHDNDAWIADDDLFEGAVQRIGDELVEGVLAVPFDGSLTAQRGLSSFVSTWMRRLQESVVVHSEPAIRSGHVALTPQAWHEIAILKFVHQRFVLERPELGVYRWGQNFVLNTVVEALDLWLEDPDESNRVPARLVDLVDLARHGYERVRRHRPDLLEGRSDLARMARGRGILDYVASLTDAQAHAMASTMTGQPTLNWGSV